MMLESHWRRIKHDFLHHFHLPRCDLLAWILIVKLAPSYYRKLDRLLTDTGQYRELPCWRKDFKHVWRWLEKAPITLPVNPAYKTDVKKFVCTCPSLPTARFLICKHLVQGVEHVPLVFFLEVKCQRTAPFWVHPSLRPLSDDSAQDASPEDVGVSLTPADTTVDAAPDWDDDDDDDVVDTGKPEDEQLTFLEVMDDNIDLILEAETEPLVKRVSKCIFRGYSTLAEAEAAYEYAAVRSWPPQVAPSTNLTNPLNGNEDFDGRWFVVYAGITPGVYRSHLECQLNTIGVRGALHESILGWSAAWRKFTEALVLVYIPAANIHVSIPLPILDLSRLRINDMDETVVICSRNGMLTLTQNV
ncbi:hypothetical protein B0H13DRAFT_2330062 [Mycena leptocephala]|nr:hypothetical protein B0H13DRAFT_2330062 [Mycena leptocephala]